MRKTFILFFWLALSSKILKAQEFTFSQFNALMQAFNPAFVGSGPQKVKATVAHRQQWLAANTPYKSTLFLADYRRNKPIPFFNHTGFGVMFVEDNLADGTLKNSWIQVSAAGHRFLDATQRHQLSFGLGGGVKLRRLNTQNLIFENQFNPSTFGFDSEMMSGETFSGQTQASLQLNSGIAYQFLVNPNVRFGAAASYLGINQPNEKLSTLPFTTSSRAKTRTTLSTWLELRASPSLKFEPQVFYHRQGSASEVVAGTWISWTNMPYKPLNTRIEPGFFWRNEDAWIPGLRIAHHQWIGAIMYDATFSNANRLAQRALPGTGGLGSIEFSLTYLLDFKIKRWGQIPVPCRVI